MQYAHYLGSTNGARYYLIEPGASCETIAAELRMTRIVMKQCEIGGYLKVWPDGGSQRTGFRQMPKEQQAELLVLYLRLHGRYPPDA